MNKLLLLAFLSAFSLYEEKILQYLAAICMKSVLNLSVMLFLFFVCVNVYVKGKYVL
jgi:hypothetical protein